VAFYTGFPSRAALMACFKFLGPADNELMYWNSKIDDAPCKVKRKGCPWKLAPIDEFFIVLVRLRLGLLEQLLAALVGVSCATISRIFTSWINFLYFKLNKFPCGPRKMLQTCLTASEICIPQHGSSLMQLKSILKAIITRPAADDVFKLQKLQHIKALVGISPSGAITFVSSLHSGSISDKELTRQSGILALLDRGDSVRGFDIETDLIPLGVKLNIP